MALFGYLFVLTGFYIIGIAVWKYRDDFYRLVGLTASALAFFVGGIAKVHGIERNPSIVVVFLFFFTIAMYALFSVSR
jgi:hypothetical protein